MQIFERSAARDCPPYLAGQFQCHAHRWSLSTSSAVRSMLSANAKTEKIRVFSRDDVRADKTACGSVDQQIQIF